ncbi:DNA primase [Streptomyces bobili]|uniref:DNA primase n=1 Tax=Streptomyces bobili TaxID=67280 RepID=UPI00341C09C2
MNRVGLGLAIGAGYVLGRTKKMKLAFAVGSMVAGKRLNLTPRALADVVSQQLKDNPQFKEIGDELRQDLRGVGKAASGAMVERQMNALADRLHSRTGQVRDQLQGVVPDTDTGKDAEESGKDDRATDEEYEEYDEPESARDEDEDEDEGEAADEDRSGDAEDAADDGEERPRRKAPVKASAKQAAAKKTAKKTAKKAPARTSPTQRTAAPARKTAEKTASRGRRPKGGGER